MNGVATGLNYNCQFEINELNVSMQKHNKNRDEKQTNEKKKHVKERFAFMANTLRNQKGLSVSDAHSVHISRVCTSIRVQMII